MYDRRLVAGGAAIALGVAAAIAFVFIAPRWVASSLNNLAQQQLGRSVSVRGGTHLDFSPLSVRLDDAALSGPAADDDSLAIASSVVIPVTLGQLFGGAPDVSTMTLTAPEIALLINERGEANWDFAGLTPRAMRLTLEQAHLRYFDVRNSQSMELDHVDGVLDLRPDGGAAFSGTAVINDRLIRIDADLKSLARINADGSPIELALSANEGTANFSGRLATAKVLSLAGPVSLASDTPGPALRLLGLPLPQGTTVTGPITVDGALDSAGRAYAIRNATLALGAFRAVGELAADLRNDQPKLQANLTADSLRLDGFVPVSGAKNGDWGRTALPFSLLKSFDAEVSIVARSLAYADVTAGASNVGATLSGGKLDVAIASQLANDGEVSFTAKADAGAVPPSVAVSIAAQDAEAQPLLGALTGARGITGKGDFAADLTASGTTQEELAGTLKGTASVGLAAGNISGLDLAGLVLAARQKILDGWPAPAAGTAFDNLNGDAAIADGIVTFRELTMQSPGLSVSVEGILDVLRQGLAISASVSANGQPLLSVPVIAKGLWAHPKIYPDVPDILNNPEGGFSRLQDGAPLQGN
ncbi:AsmA family protein [Aestuariivirga sp.]|uniref:AsmA family protein n=1 Tax=Aestuariivirga sp. TaxID=2650926 RepID=UPI00301A6159